jgi:hypothetical protein
MIDMSPRGASGASSSYLTEPAALAPFLPRLPLPSVVDAPWDLIGVPSRQPSPFDGA